MTQDGLSDSLGFKDRQTLAAIEAGKRRVSSEELVRLSKILRRSVEFFTDPFILEGEAQFSFRAAEVTPESELKDFEQRAGEWIAFWREQSCGRKLPLAAKLELSERSSFEDAASYGEALAIHWQLGGELGEEGVVPADGLVEAIEKDLNVLVLYVSMPKGISGAACQLPGSNTILVNKDEPEGRRNFDIAHELFHILTWDSMPPQRRDFSEPGKGKRREQLADAFASALLMPRWQIEVDWQKAMLDGKSVDEVISTFSPWLKVSPQALAYRLKNLGLISAVQLDELIRRNPARQKLSAPVPLFSQRYMECAKSAIEKARVSVSRLIKLLGLSSGRIELKELFAQHGIVAPEGI